MKLIPIFIISILIIFFSAQALRCRYAIQKTPNE